MCLFNAAMPNGAYPAGILGSRNAVDDFTLDQFEVNTSTLPWWKSVAKRRGLPLTFAIAKPLNTAFVTDFALTALVPALQPLSTPDSLSKMNDEGEPPALKPLEELKTCPVGAPPGM